MSTPRPFEPEPIHVVHCRICGKPITSANEQAGWEPLHRACLDSLPDSRVELVAEMRAFGLDARATDDGSIGVFGLLEQRGDTVLGLLEAELQRLNEGTGFTTPRLRLEAPE